MAMSPCTPGTASSAARWRSASYPVPRRRHYRCDAGLADQSAHRLDAFLLTATTRSEPVLMYDTSAPIADTSVLPAAHRLTPLSLVGLWFGRALAYPR